MPDDKKSVDDFVEMLDSEFKGWENRESNKEGKIEGPKQKLKITRCWNCGEPIKNPNAENCTKCGETLDLVSKKSEESQIQRIKKQKQKETIVLTIIISGVLVGLSFVFICFISYLIAIQG